MSSHKPSEPSPADFKETAPHDATPAPDRDTDGAGETGEGGPAAEESSAHPS